MRGSDGDAMGSDPASTVLTVRTSSARETVDLGRRLGPLLAGGVLVSIEGDLGVGKTQLCKGMISGATGIGAEVVSSPAYTLINQYPWRDHGCLVHIDFYRLDRLGVEDEMLFDEAVTADCVVAALIEWGDKFVSVLSSTYVRIRMVREHALSDACIFTLDVVGDGIAEGRVVDGWQSVCALS
jgi:tRNA threonylcarbamoyladenosine biosynthesis protein TsaE